MKEYGKGESWTPMFEIPSDYGFFGNLNPSILMRNGRVVMIADGFNVLIYNPEKTTCEFSTNVFAVDEKGAKIHDSILVESLVSPIGYDWNDEQHQGLGKDINWLDGPYSYTDTSDDEDWKQMLDDCSQDLKENENFVYLEDENEI
ncbi:hypothetical protein ACH5RR_031225 [Cinchona calisaya]|uniref:Uncharacterized protein n=1 Tax=Cinchona calisaya TaxID=153742 RepID=A0ABD2YEL2_9GENT